MKKIFLSFAIVMALASTGCRHGEMVPASATLILGFGGLSSLAKSIAPEEINVSTINIEGLGPGGARKVASSSDYSPVELELLPGTWVITAKGMNDKGIEVASGFLELSIGPSEKLRKDIFLAPFAGEGSISLSWTLSGSLAGTLSVEGSLISSQGTILPIVSAFSTAGGEAGGGSLRFEGLRNGGWTLELRLLQDGLALCGLADGLLVAAGMETKLAVSFQPPEASLTLGLVLPDYSNLSFQVEPSLRRAAQGTSLVFRGPFTGIAAWYSEGILLSPSEPELVYTPSGESSGERIDCLQLGSSLIRSGSAGVKVRPSQTLGALSWGELVDQSTGSAASQAAMRGLGDCRDLAWSADGSYLAAAGKSSSALSLFEAPRPGAVFAIAGLGGSEESGLPALSVLRFLPSGSLLALSETAGAAFSIAVQATAGGGNILRLEGSFADACLAGAKDIALPADASCAYVAAQTANDVALLVLDEGGQILSASSVAANGESGLESFSKPGCIALSPDDTLLALGTIGDDAIYFFDRDVGSNGLSFASRLDKGAFPATAPLSDPCSLAFSADAASLFVLSYYGKALIRLDRNPENGLYSVTASVKSGSGTVTGFASPKRLALSPDGSLLAVIGSGSEDGLSLFEVGAPAELTYIGTILSSAGDALPKKPGALAFSPNGSVLVVASDGFASFFQVNFP